MAGEIVMCVDDSRLVLAVQQEALASAGYQVITAFSAEEALRKIEQQRPHLICSDITMPGMDGYAFARRLRSQDSTKHLPILLVTTRTSIEEKIAGFESGADDYMTKPFEPSELVARVRSLLARAATFVAMPQPTLQQGKVAVFFSLKGGVGTTMLVANVAAALRQLWEIDVAAVDLSLESPDLDVKLDVTPRYDLGLLTKEPVADITKEVMREYLSVSATGIHLLAGPGSPQNAELVTSQLVETSLFLVRSLYPVVVTDTSCSFSEPVLAAMDASSFIYLVVTPDMSSLRATAQALKTFQSLKISPEQYGLVLNYTMPRSDLEPRVMESALRRQFVTVVPYCDRALMLGNSGKLLVEGLPDHPTSRALQALAFHFSHELGAKPKQLAQQFARVAS